MSPLKKSTIEIPLVHGIDTKTDPFQLQIGQLSALENGVFTNPKEIAKRNGTEPFSTTLQGGGNISNSKAIAAFKNELVQITNPNLYSFSESTNAWTSKGNNVSVSVVNTTVSSQTSASNSTLNQDGAYHSSGVFLTCWQGFNSSIAGAVPQSTGVFYSITDYETGELIVSNTSTSSNAINPKAIVIGGYFFLFYVDTSNNHLKLITIPAGNPTSPNAVVDVTSNINASNRFYDVCTYSTTIYIAYNTNGTAIGLRTTDAGLAISAETTIAGEVASYCISICADESNGNIWVSYFNGTAVKAFARTSTLGTLLSAVTIETLNSVRNISSHAILGTATFLYEVIVTSSDVAISFYVKIRKNTCTSLGVVGSSSLFLTNLGLVSKTFKNNGTYYVIIVFQSVFQATYFVVNLSGTAVAKVLPFNSGGLTNIVGGSGTFDPTTASTLCEVNTIDSNNYVVALLQQKGSQYLLPGPFLSQTSEFFADATLFGTIFSTLSFNSGTYQSIDIANGLQISGGFLSLYDGVSTSELGFHLFPESIVASAATSGGYLDDGSYQYVATYEWSDNYGQVQRSARTPFPTTVVMSGGSGSGVITLKIQTLGLTAKSNCYIVIYRTNANGIAFYRLPSINLNSVTSPTVTVTDGASLFDNNLAGYQELYTDTGEVDNDAPPACSLIKTFKTRVIAVPTETPTSFWYSKDVTPGVPVEFSESFIQNITTVGGGITAVSQLDDKLILFKKSLIAYMFGSGPALNGSNNDFSDAQILPTDVGCTDPNSVVLFPDGIIFKSEKGIYTLNRSLQVSYIGAQVEAYNSDTITSAILVPSTQEIRFTLDSGVSITYNYLVGQWGVNTNINAASATIWNDTYTYLSATPVTATTITGTTTSGGFQITSASSINGINAGQQISGTGIPTGTTVVSAVGTTITISQAATAAGSGVIFSLLTSQTLQETIGSYTDNNQLIPLHITTGWLNFSGVQGYMRIFKTMLLGTWYSPHTLIVNLYTDYDPNPNQTIYINAPTSSMTDQTYGDGATFGSETPYGGGGAGDAYATRYQWNIWNTFQRCESLKIDIIDSQNVPYGQGYSLSNIAFEIGIEGGAMRLPASRKVG